MMPSSVTTTTAPSWSMISASTPRLEGPLPLECDYDVRPTLLYRMIQAREWDRVLELLEEDVSDVGGGVDGEAERAARTWVVRKEPNGQLRWRLLPLHASIIFGAPFEVVDALVGAYPGAASAKDDQGMIPLHLSLRNRPVDWRIVEELLAANPGGVGTKDRKGRTPLQGASAGAKSGTPGDPALAVLKLYTQIAVAMERASILSSATTSTMTPAVAVTAPPGVVATLGPAAGDPSIDSTDFHRNSSGGVTTPMSAKEAVGAGSNPPPATATGTTQMLQELELQRQQLEEEREAWEKRLKEAEEAAQNKLEASLQVQHELREELDLAVRQLERMKISSSTTYPAENCHSCDDDDEDDSHFASAEEVTWKGLCLQLLRQQERVLKNSARFWEEADRQLRQEDERLAEEFRLLSRQARALLLSRPPMTPNTVADAAREQDILLAAASTRSDLERRVRGRSVGASAQSSDDAFDEKKEASHQHGMAPLSDHPTVGLPTAN